MKKLLRLLFRLFLFALVVIAGICFVKTLAYSSQQVPVAPIDMPPINNEPIERLAKAISFPTVSRAQSVDSIAFIQMDSFIIQAYPLIDSLLEKNKVGQLSITYKWPGKNNKLTPILLMSHQDVVPVEEISRKEWTVPPFSGEVKDGFLWGRGTMDDKCGVFGILEAVEWLLREDYQPERTVYLSFGHDEETGGGAGAKEVAALFERQKIEFEYVLDEGQIILENALSGLKPPLAMIGIAEKGATTLTLTARLKDGGHSSMPPSETAVGVLSKAITQLEANPFPGKLDGATGDFFRHIGPEMTPLYKTIFANQWLTKNIVLGILSGDPASSALVRTTTAPTMLRGGIIENVLPSQASAKVNFRILPGESVESVIEYVRKTIDDDRVIITESETRVSVEPSPVSETDAFGFQVIQKTIQELFPETVVAPSLVIAGTDSKHFTKVSKQVYRFLPIQLSRPDLKRIHGINERIEVENYKRMIAFYRQLIMNSCK